MIRKGLKTPGKSVRKENLQYKGLPDLAFELAKELQIKVDSSKCIIDMLLHIVTRELLDGYGWRFQMFAKFDLKKVKESTIYSEKERREVVIPEHDIISMKPSDNLLEMLRGTREPFPKPDIYALHRYNEAHDLLKYESEKIYYRRHGEMIEKDEKPKTKYKQIYQRFTYQKSSKPSMHRRLRFRPRKDTAELREYRFWNTGYKPLTKRKKKAMDNKKKYQKLENPYKTRMTKSVLEKVKELDND